MTDNPILDFYIMAYTAGYLKYPVFKILEMPSNDGKSLTAYRFSRHAPDILFLAGDVTAQSFRNAIYQCYQKQQADRISLVIVEDASKIRYKVRDDFFSLAAQFSSRMVNVDQRGMKFDLKTHASVVINTPPYFTKTLENILLKSGCGDRFDTIITELIPKCKKELNTLGIYNMPNNVNPFDIQELQIADKENFPAFVQKYKKHPIGTIKCMYACHCAGIDTELILKLPKKINKIDWTGFWENQVTPPPEGQTNFDNFDESTDLTEVDKSVLARQKAQEIIEKGNAAKAKKQKEG